MTSAEGPAYARPRRNGAGVFVAVRVTPRAGRSRVLGVGTGAEGERRLRVAVKEPPDGGRANAALIALLARRWRLPKSALSIHRGAAARHKTVLVAGEPADILDRIARGDGRP